jgi:hypothetical protein
MKKIVLGLLASLAVLAPVAAEARHGYRHHHDRGYYDRDYRDYRGYRDYRYRDYDRYDRRGPYRYGYRERCRSGSTGTVLGAIAGGLLGRSIDTEGDRATGTILGAGAGALAGRSIDRNCR